MLQCRVGALAHLPCSLLGYCRVRGIFPPLPEALLVFFKSRGTETAVCPGPRAGTVASSLGPLLTTPGSLRLKAAEDSVFCLPSQCLI